MTPEQERLLTEMVEEARCVNPADPTRVVFETEALGDGRVRVRVKGIRGDDGQVRPVDARS